MTPKLHPMRVRCISTPAEELISVPSQCVDLHRVCVCGVFLVSHGSGHQEFCVENRQDFHFCWMQERSVEIQHRTDRAGWDVGRRNEGKHLVNFVSVPKNNLHLYSSSYFTAVHAIFKTDNKLPRNTLN